MYSEQVAAADVALWCNWLTRRPLKAKSSGSSPDSATKVLKRETQAVSRFALRVRIVGMSERRTVTNIAAWFLCAMVALLLFASPHCEACDGLPVMAAHLPMQAMLQRSGDVLPDACNGACACCGVHWLPSQVAMPVPWGVPAALARPLVADVPRTLSAVLFRPPRIFFVAH